MKHLIKVFMMVGLVLGITLGSAGNSFSLYKFTLLDREMSVSGYLQFDTGSSCRGGDWKIYHAITTVRAEADYNISDNVKMYGAFSYLFDHIYNLRSDSDSFERYKSSREWMQDDYEYNDRWGELVREIYFDIYTPNIDFRIGKFSWAWGEADGVKLTDLINPVDYRREFALRDPGWDETRIPQFMIKGEYFIPFETADLHDLSLEIIVIPDVRENKLGLAYEGKAKGMAMNGPWGIPQPYLPPVFKELIISAKERNTSLRNTEIAVRFRGTYGGTSFTLNYYDGWNDDMVIRVTVADIFGLHLTDKNLDTVLPFLDPLLCDLPPDLLTAYANGEYRRMRVAGFSLCREIEHISWRKTCPVLRMEAVYSFNQTFNNDGDEWGELAWITTKGLTKKDQLRYMIAFDWPIWIRTLNKRQTFFCTGQFIQYRTMNYDKKLVMLPFYFEEDLCGRDPYKIPKESNIWTASVETGWDNDRIHPNFFFMQDIQGEGHMYQFKINLNYTNHWRPEFGIRVYDGDPGKSVALFDDRDEIYCRIRYMW